MFIRISFSFPRILRLRGRRAAKTSTSASRRASSEQSSSEPRRRPVLLLEPTNIPSSPKRRTRLARSLLGPPRDPIVRNEPVLAPIPIFIAAPDLTDPLPDTSTSAPAPSSDVRPQADVDVQAHGASAPRLESTAGPVPLPKPKPASTHTDANTTKPATRPSVGRVAFQVPIAIAETPPDSSLSASSTLAMADADTGPVPLPPRPHYFVFPATSECTPAPAPAPARVRTRPASLAAPRPVHTAASRFSLPARPAASISTRVTKRSSVSTDIGSGPSAAIRKERNARWSRAVEAPETQEVLRALSGL